MCVSVLLHMSVCECTTAYLCEFTTAYVCVARVPLRMCLSVLLHICVCGMTDLSLFCVFEMRAWHQSSMKLWKYSIDLEIHAIPFC